MRNKYFIIICFTFLFCLFNIYAFNILVDENNVTCVDKYDKYKEYREKYAKSISEWDKPNIDEGVYYDEMQPLPNIAPYTNENPYTEEKSFLGKRLFNEANLSKSSQIACASCHNKELAFGDGIKTSFGHNRQRGKRNSPNIMMSGFFNKLFWDGRADSLESQALMPIVNPIEMAHNLDDMQEFIINTTMYYPLFIFAFGDTKHKQGIYNFYLNKIKDSKAHKLNMQNIDKYLLSMLIRADIRGENIDILLHNDILPFNYKNYAKSIIKKENIAKAIASYERSLVPQYTRFNEFLKGNYKILNNKEIYGLHIFRTKGRCMNCHYGVALSDGKFHNIGLSFYGRELQDLGRYNITKDKKDLGAFKTPSLIAVSTSFPYMHNGIFPNLRGVLNMYNAGFPEQNIKQNNDLIPQKNAFNTAT